MLRSTVVWIATLLVQRPCDSFRAVSAPKRPLQRNVGTTRSDNASAPRFATNRSLDLVNGETFAEKGTITKIRSDSLEQFSLDVTRVLKDLKTTEFDPEIPALFRHRRLSFTNYWTQVDWVIHSSRFRFVRYMRGLPTSRLLRRILPQLSVLIAWSILAMLAERSSRAFHQIKIPLTSLSLVSTFVAALQALRSSQGLVRLKDGREAMGKVVLLTRDTALLFSTYIYPKDKELGLMAARHLALLPWSLKAHFRDSEEDEVMHMMLPFDADADFVHRQRKKPVAIIARLRQIMFDMSERKLINTTEHRLIEDNLRGIDHIIMVGERIRSTPTPPVYVAHSTRLMMFYLFFLPMALLGTHLNGIPLVFVTTAVGYAMLGLDEVSVLFEEPYRLMPLYQIAKVSMLDVTDAFTMRPPSLRPQDNTEPEHIETTSEHSMPYW